MEWIALSFLPPRSVDPQRADAQGKPDLDACPNLTCGDRIRVGLDGTVDHCAIGDRCDVRAVPEHHARGAADHSTCEQRLLRLQAINVLDERQDPGSDIAFDITGAFGTVLTCLVAV
ncbi:MAG: hypothetical protein WCD75_02060, partial [Rhodoplanes sp.]